MKLSIITVNLNNREGLQRTIDSVICQTFRDFEWIVIDGGSTDGSRELIEQYADHFAYWVSEPDKGIYNAMNKGIKVAKGEYLQFLNSGDWLYSKDSLLQFTNELHDDSIIYGDGVFMHNDGTNSVVKFENSFHFSYLVLGGSLFHCSTAIKRSLLIEDPYDENLRMVSDWKFFLRKSLEGVSYRHIDTIISVFDGSGISSINPQLSDLEHKKVIDEEVPTCIQADCQLIKNMQSQLHQWQVWEVLHFSQQSKFYHKVISVCLWFIKLIDNNKHPIPKNKL